MDYTRKEIVDILKAEGLEISPRTLRYWEQKGHIDKPIRDGRYAKHPAGALEHIRLLAATRPVNVRKTRQQSLSDYRNGNRSRVTKAYEQDGVLVVHIRYGKKKPSQD